MKAVLFLMDSINRRALGCYGGDAVPTPNFDRLAARAVTFDTHYVGSLPCMPARREMHTGRLNFLHRSWGPLEPFDDSLPMILHEEGIYSHLVTDHLHYFEDGGATYHTKYDSYDYVRGQENDPWRGLVNPPLEKHRETYHPRQYSDARRTKFLQYIINRERFVDDEDFPSTQCMRRAFDFLDENRDEDGWFLHLETFDPHEPFHAPQQYRERFPTDYDGPVFDWPPYARDDLSSDEAAELRANYAAILSRCDDHLGWLLDYFDAHSMWDDTMLIVSTDHGFLLGEHDWWAKNQMPCFDEIARIPMFVYHPDFKAQGGKRRSALTQTIDFMPTVLDSFGIVPPADTLGRSLLPILESESAIRDGALYGMYGGAINVTDGRYTYFRYPENQLENEPNQYTLMPTHMARMFGTDELREATLAPPFAFTKGVPVLRIPCVETSRFYGHQGPGIQKDTQTVLYDLESDPKQERPLDDPDAERRMTALLIELMRANDAPSELYNRFGLHP